MAFKFDVKVRSYNRFHVRRHVRVKVIVTTIVRRPYDDRYGGDQAGCSAGDGNVGVRAVVANGR
jgi:hypothetical protein